MQRRVVITGLGVISPVGTGLENFWNALTSGVSGIKRISRFDPTGFNSQIAGEVQGFDPTSYLDKKEIRHMDRFTQYAVSAAKMAIKDASLKLEIENCNRIGIILGTGIGGMETFEEQSKVLLERGPRRVSPFFIPMMIANMGAAQAAITFGLKGPNITITTACASSSNAIGDSFRLIQHGQADIMITGGSEAAVTPLAVAGFCSMKSLSTHNDQPKKASRPFDAKRDGFIISEGAAILILEDLEHACRRGVRIYAEIIGYSSTCDAYHITAPNPEGFGASMAMSLALEDAGVHPSEVDYINAHGTSTPLNDKQETLATKQVFGLDAKKVAISSTKSMTGHLLGAAGGVESIASVMAIHTSIIPPTINYENPDPECDLDYVPNHARTKEVRIVLSNSLGFGGQNVSLVFKKYY